MLRCLAVISVLAGVLLHSKCYSQSFDLTLEAENEMEKKNKDSQASMEWWKGRRQFGRAILFANELVRESANHYSVRAELWMEVGEYDRAIEDWNNHLKFAERLGQFFKDRRTVVDPTIRARGRAYAAKGQYDLAIADFRASNSAGELAWLMATCPDPKYRDGKAALNYAKVAAAFAEAGNFSDAIRWEEQALAAVDERKAEYARLCLAGTHEGDYLIANWIRMAEFDREKEEYASRLALFRQNKPFRDLRPTNFLESRKRGGELYKFALENANKEVSQDKLDAAIAQADKVVNLAPNRGASYFVRAKLRVMAKKDYDLAIRDCSQAVRFLYTREQIGKCLSLRGDAWERTGDYKRALADYQLAIKLSPDDKEIAGGPAALEFLHLPEVLQIRKDAEAEAKVDAIDPRTAAYPSGYCAERGRVAFSKDDFVGAIKHTTKAINYDEKNEKAYQLRGEVWLSKGFFEAAQKDLAEAIRISPKNKEAYVLRGITWAEMRQLDKAIGDYSEAIRQDPDYVSAYWHRSLGWLTLGSFSEALNDLSEVIRIDPEHFNAFMGRAWIRATCNSPRYRNGEQAISDATRACELTAWKHDLCLDILAAAHAEAGDFAKAVEFGEKAVSLSDGRWRDMMSAHLSLYRDGKPLRENRDGKALREK